jgi:hypothetical protein
MRSSHLDAVPGWFSTNITRQKDDRRTLVLRSAILRGLGWSNESLLKRSLVTGYRSYVRIRGHLVILRILLNGHSTSYRESSVRTGGECYGGRMTTRESASGYDL